MHFPVKPKRTHGQITQSLKQLAKQHGKNPNDVYNQFFREVFLHELMQRNDGWVLKGGTNIYCRIPGARHTKDLDLYREEDPTSSPDAAQALVSAMNGHKVGPYMFVVKHSAGSGLVGTIASERVDVSVVHGVNRRLMSFGVDVSGDLKVIGAAETVTVTTSYAVPVEFMPPSFKVASYPPASQIADKVCAMYERHGGTPPGKASTRYHDLYDLALMALELQPTTGALTAADLYAALDTQRAVRNIELPDEIRLPDDNWIDGYPAKARQFGDKRWGLDNLDEALRIAGLLVNPVLSGVANSPHLTWNCTKQLWE